MQRNELIDFCNRVSHLPTSMTGHGCPSFGTHFVDYFLDAGTLLSEPLAHVAKLILTGDRWNPFARASRLLRPYLIGTRRKGLVRSEIRALDLSEDEVLRWNRAPRQTPQQGQLPRVGHSVGKRTL